MADVAFYRPSSSYDVWRETLPHGGYVEWDFNDVITNVTEISGTNATQDYVNITPLMTSPSVVEFAAQLSQGGVPCGGDCFFGGGHGNVTRLSKSITLDGTDITNTANGSYLTGSTLVMTQTFNILLPLNPTIVAGTYKLTHTLTSSGLEVDKVLTFATPPQYEWWSVYSAMLPLQGFNQVQFGSGSVEAITSPSTPVTKDLGSNVSSIKASSTAHPYVMTLTLPTGYPDDLNSWSNSNPDGAFWIDQVGAKAYICSVTGEYAGRHTAFTRTMKAVYQLSVL